MNQSKPTRRSKRLERYLRNELGWSTTEYKRQCPKCAWKFDSIYSTYCTDCGSKLGKPKDESRGAIYTDIENALKYALEEEK